MTSFATDIRPLFTEEDVEHMLDFDMDLSKHESVSEHAEEIHERLADGTMPPGTPWPEEQVALFRKWIDEGCQP
jgi:hypothetical protein